MAITFLIEPHIDIPIISLVFLSFNVSFSRVFFSISYVFLDLVATDNPIGELVIISRAKDGPDITAILLVLLCFL